MKGSPPMGKVGKGASGGKKITGFGSKMKSMGGKSSMEGPCKK